MGPSVVVLLTALCTSAAPVSEQYQDKATRDLVALVNDAAGLVATRGEAAFPDLRVSGSRWRRGETYVFVLDPEGNMLVHPDPALEGKNTARPEGHQRQTHHPRADRCRHGGPRKAGRLVSLRMAGDRWAAPALEEQLRPARRRPRPARATSSAPACTTTGWSGSSSSTWSRTPSESSRRTARPPFPSSAIPRTASSRRTRMSSSSTATASTSSTRPSPTSRAAISSTPKDTQGKPFVREMLDVVQKQGSGWVDYLWPKPGESVSTLKSAYVSKARLGDKTVLVGCGVYLANAPKRAAAGKKLTAPELMSLVRQAAAVLDQQGEKAYPEFRTEGVEVVPRRHLPVRLDDEGHAGLSRREPRERGQGRERDEGRPRAAHRPDVPRGGLESLGRRLGALPLPRAREHVPDLEVDLREAGHLPLRRGAPRRLRRLQPADGQDLDRGRGGSRRGPGRRSGGRTPSACCATRPVRSSSWTPTCSSTPPTAPSG